MGSVIQCTVSLPEALIVSQCCCSCRFILGGDQGKLRYGPPNNFSSMQEAVRGELEIVPCFTFGDINKNVYYGPATASMNTTAFVPQPVDISRVNFQRILMWQHQSIFFILHK